MTDALVTSSNKLNIRLTNNIATTKLTYTHYLLKIHTNLNNKYLIICWQSVSRIWKWHTLLLIG